ncbi:MAG: GntR family transcriptional regulator [Methylobacteriaceae bacterium]|nr:GntR family transcriptional regulator [Methylobacteriaceae bacterium]
MPAERHDDNRSSANSQRIFEVLRQAIVQLHLRPGHALSESEIAKQFNISRQPVREAFIKLNEIRLVEIRPRRGTFVRLISLHEIDNARFLREAIEAAVVRSAAEKASSADVAGLKNIIFQHHELAQERGYLKLLLHDETFHQSLARIAGRGEVWSVIQAFKTQVDRARFFTAPDEEAIRVMIQQHSEIIDGIEKGDPDIAEIAMRRHLHEIERFLPSLAETNPSYFTD